jgi:antitoxin component of RelBE/YafQ-DinJ toxin-antitoxin module
MTQETEELQIELDDETALIAQTLAEEKGVTVEELLQDLLSRAIEEGYFENAENITTDDPLE